MRPGWKSRVSDQNYLWQGGSSIATCSRTYYQNFIRLLWDTLDIPRKVSPEARDIPRHGSWAWLVGRFWSWPMMTGHDMKASGKPRTTQETARKLSREPQGISRGVIGVVRSILLCVQNAGEKHRELDGRKWEFPGTDGWEDFDLVFSISIIVNDNVIKNGINLLSGNVSKIM